LDELFVGKIDAEQLKYYIGHQISDEVVRWLDTNVNVISED
jgi:hypothetical protein